MVFTTLAHLMDEDFLTEAFHQLRKDAAAGIDQMSAEEYERNLRERITELHAPRSLTTKLSHSLNNMKTHKPQPSPQQGRHLAVGYSDLVRPASLILKTSHVHLAIIYFFPLYSLRASQPLRTDAFV